MERKEAPLEKVGGGKILRGAQAAAEFTGFKRSWIFQLAMQRKIPCYKVGNSLFFVENELRDWLLSGRRRTADELMAEAEAHPAS